MPTTVREQLWLWGHDVGAHNQGWGLPQPSRITPAEAASYLGVPNLIMVRYHGRPALPFDQYAVPFRALKRVVWSVVGARGETNDAERRHVLDLAAHHPNVSGVMLDDFFAGAPETYAQGEELAVLSLEQLHELRGQLVVAGRRLELWAVLYDYQLDKPLGDYFQLLDKITLWTWDSEQLGKLQRHLEKLEELAPRTDRLLGCYMWDYGQRRPMSLERMKQQCEVGLDWIAKGKIDGMIFLASCICDLELEAVEWTRRWIAEVGDGQVSATTRISRCAWEHSQSTSLT